MSLSAIALAALLTAQPSASEPSAAPSLASGATSVGELHLRVPGSAKARRPRVSWSRTPPKGLRPLAPARRGFVLYPQGENCGSVFKMARGKAAENVEPLSKMPSAHLEFAVARLVDGCPVAALMRADDEIR